MRKLSSLLTWCCTASLALAVMLGCSSYADRQDRGSGKCPYPEMESIEKELQAFVARPDTLEYLEWTRTGERGKSETFTIIYRFRGDDGQPITRQQSFRFENGQLVEKTSPSDPA
ncbi:hypothetical protein HRbin36_02732 [bacterium HR36]|nr:hypothetical protein HRbin36_02732 [bacterium HR36]